ncbi:hypothetical protein I4U23_005442 [Adineta vaga]|nr:hypothetical protein I4U23_005442 [Adineta vaga]
MKNNNYEYYPLQDDDDDTTAITTYHNDIMNYTFIWLDEEALNLTLLDTRLTIDMFKSIENTNYLLYNNSELFLEEIQSMAEKTRLVIIMSGCFAENLLPKLSSLLREICSIFIFCKDSTNYKYLLKQCRKIIDICTDNQSLKEAIEEELHPSKIFFIMDRDLNPLFSLKYDSEEFNAYKQNIENLKSYPWTSNSREKMLDECEKQYRKNNAQRRKIEEFKYNYTPETAIRWYTRDSFLYRLVNKALRSLDMDQINIFRPFIRDLCAQLEQLHKQNQLDLPLTVFRGHGNMTENQFEKIKRNIGTLISFNGFLSTTKDKQVAIDFAGSMTSPNKSILFEIQTNYNLKNVIFADISQFSDMQSEQEVLFSLCSIFRINDIIDDKENQLSKIIISATDEDAVDNSEQINIEISFINQYCQKKYMIKVFVTIVFMMIVASGVILGINFKLKDQNRSSYNCIDHDNCTNFITTTIALRKTSIQPITNLINTISTTISTPIDCVPVGWDYRGHVITSDHPLINFAVDDDLNMYVVNQMYQSLDKWSYQGTLIKRLYSQQFDTYSPLFFHSPSQSLYFCNEFKGELGVFKITNENPIPINVIKNMTNELGMSLHSSSCTRLYVNSPGDIFMLDMVSHIIRKWTVNSSSAIVAANGNKTDSIRYPYAIPNDFTVDEVNNIIYLVDVGFPRILKYINGLERGITFIDGTPNEIFSSVKSIDINAFTIALDKTGYIIVGEKDKITIWSSDGKFNGIAMNKYQFNNSIIIENITTGKIILDRLGNLYGSVNPGLILRFNRTSITCKNNVV